MAAATQQRSTKLTKFGLEVPLGLTYQGWEPGGEYTKHLVLKNVQLKTQKIRYKISGSQFSSAVYPQPIVLSAGTSYTLSITFRPSGKNPYEESIELQTSEGVFNVPVRAPVPCSNLALPESLKFGMCAVGHSVTVNFEVSNLSPTVATDFNWKLPQGFEVSHSSGSLTPKHTCKLTANFRPSAATVYDAMAICSFGTGDECNTKEMRLEGIGKYPHVIVKVSPGKGSGKASVPPKKVTEDASEGRSSASSGGAVVVNFGAVAVGSIAEKWIEIANVSPVTATFSLTPLSPTSLTDSHFGCSQYEGPIQPHASARIKILYTPSVVNAHPSMAFFSVKAIGGLGSSTLKCIGKPTGPLVSIDETVLSFGSVECGRTATGIMHIRNDSDVSTIFQLQLDPKSVFHTDVLCGQLSAQSSQTIMVHFSPQSPIPYCKRVACLVQHQGPLFIYFIGTSFTETIKPAVLQPKHVHNFLTHAKNGLSRLPPEQLLQLLKEEKLTVDPTSGSLQPSESFEGAMGEQPLPRLCPEDSAYGQYLHSEHEPSGIPHISTDVDVLKFNYCPPNLISESKLVSITNHTLGTVCCVWMTSSSDAFCIIPNEREIPAGKTGSFAINFKPEKPGLFYAREMECFAFYKTLCDYHHVDTAAISPPWCLTVRASGHTFAPGTENFLPKVTFDPKNMIFPATIAGQPSYRTAIMRNTGDTPVLFDLSSDPTETFLVKPSHGLLQDSYQVFAFQMLPKEAKVYKHVLKCQLNASDSNQQDLLLSGSGESPIITLGNESQLFFRPTCVKTTASSLHSLTNTCRLPLHFRWNLEGVEPGLLRVSPSAGTILPHETQTHDWQFTPQESRHYSLRAILQVSLSPLGGGAGGVAVGLSPRRVKTVLSVFGQGSYGEIQCHPSTLGCGTVIIGTSQSHTLTLFNPGPCPLYYRLEVEGEEGGGATSGDCRQLLELSHPEGALPPQAQRHLRVTVRPALREDYHCRITYQLLTAEKGGQPISLPEGAEPTLCRVEVHGAYPNLQISDVRGEGMANTVSKARLSHMLSIQLLNSYLGEEPSSTELRYAIATRHSMRHRVPVHTRAIVDFDFGATPLDSDSSTVHLILENQGDVPTDWAFQFPSDMHLEPEYWAETGSLDEGERQELEVMQNELFSVKPKRGALQPGEKITATCIYRHTLIGASKLPVLLKINRGREILLNWSGVTVAPGRPYVHLISHHHTFEPVPIGAHAYPRQVYELHNAGDTPVDYDIDTQPLTALREDNYLMSILECLHPKGRVPPGGCVAVGFVFSPPEAKRYAVDLPIHFSSGDTTLITFTGEGYDPQCLADQEPALPHHQDNTGSKPTPTLIPGQLAQLSQENISFGHLPLFAILRRMLFIQNPSSHTLSFEWDLSSERGREVLSVQPVRGYIQPQQSVAFRITFCSHSSPANYHLDVTCKVTDESEMLSYWLKLQQWERLQEEKKHTFTITGADDPAQDVTMRPAKKRPQTMPKLKSLCTATKLRPGSSDSNLRGRYQTLPPIGRSEESYEEWKRKDLSVKSKSRPRARKGASNHTPPIPPAPLLLHLGVTAQTHSIPDYTRLFRDLDCFHIDLQALMGGTPPPGTEEWSPAQLRIRREEKEVAESVLNQMIRELLGDTNFHSALESIAVEPIPYFTQFSSQAGPSDTTKQSALHRHIHAAGLEKMASLHHHPSPHPLSPSQPEYSLLQELTGSPIAPCTPLAQSIVDDREEQSQSVTSFQEEILSDTAALDETIKHLPEFASLVESVLENTLLNVLKEANSGELNITSPIYTIAKPLPTDTVQ